MYEDTSNSQKFRFIDHSKLHQLACLLVLCISFSASVAEPVTEWATWTGPEKLAAAMNSVRHKYCMPDSEAFVIPVLPSMKLASVYWINEQSPCNSEGELDAPKISSALFYSKEQATVLVQSYRVVLDGMGFIEYRHHNGLSDGSDPMWSEDSILRDEEPSVIFLKRKVGKFVWNEHIYSAPHVIINRAPDRELWKSSGFRTSIEISQEVR